MSAIDVHELHDRRQRDDAHVVLDVREPTEWAICRLPGTLAIPLGDLPDRVDEVPRDRPIYCLCHHGVRSAAAAAWLRARGLDATNVTGGIDAWSREVDGGVPRY